MKVAILGWGSLVWDPRELPHYGPWREGGPRLQIDFSRVSRDGRLTLVLDPDAPKCPTRFALSPRTDPSDAIEDLRRREGTVNRHIGFLTRTGADSRMQFPQQIDIGDQIRAWIAEQEIDACIWTALPRNFAEEVGVKFDPDSAMKYLRGLPKSAREMALKYVRNAPDEIDTPTRRAIQREWPLN